MNDIVFFITLIVLTIAHVIGDFRTPYRTFDRTSWKTMLLSEYVLVLNPMHGLWDHFSPFRRHPRYLKPMNWKVTDLERPMIVSFNYYTKYDVPKGVHPPSWFAQNAKFVIDDQRFWVWLGIDQAYHIFSNIFVAWLLALLAVLL